MVSTGRKGLKMKYIYLIGILFFTISCKYQGTDTGNPLTTVPAIQGSATYIVAETACDQVASCDSSASASVCLQANQNLTSFGIKLGLSIEDSDWTLTEIILHEYSGDIVADQNALDACTVQIQNLSCSNTDIQNAHDINLVNPYEKLSEILPSSCGNIF
jgi:hypothetical protein